MVDALELLLKTEIPALPEKTYKVKRLSAICGDSVVFKLQALPYNRAAEISKKQSEDMNVHIVLAGTIEPNLKSTELLAKYNAVTPAELVKKMLLPGEIEDLSRAIEKLSGYREVTLEEIKKK
jgi:hypothetical protein